MSKLETNTIDTVSGTTNLTIGSTNSSTVTFENGAATGHCYPAWSAFLNADQSVANGAVTKVTMNQENFDTDSAFDTSTNRFTVPSGKAGNYFVTAQIRVGSSSDFDALYIYIKKNGSDFLFNAERNEYRNGVSITHCVPLVASDYLDVHIYNGHSTSVNVQGTTGGNRSTFFSGFRIGA
jgi:hypothetical protein